MTKLTFLTPTYLNEKFFVLNFFIKQTMFSTNANARQWLAT